jgi:hypothetical protein
MVLPILAALRIFFLIPVNIYTKNLSFFATTVILIPCLHWRGSKSRNISIKDRFPHGNKFIGRWAEFGIRTSKIIEHI